MATWPSRMPAVHVEPMAGRRLLVSASGPRGNGSPERHALKKERMEGRNGSEACLSLMVVAWKPRTKGRLGRVGHCGLGPWVKLGGVDGPGDGSAGQSARD
jgi:hypothetical protein